MRDDRDLWAPALGLAAPLALHGADLSAVSLMRQSLISRIASLPKDEPQIGWPDVVETDCYRLSLRRDRIVEINCEARPEGWDASRQQAVSDVTHGYSVFHLSGPNALGILKRGTEISLNTPSRSVARVLFGLDVWLYRFGAEDAFRLHVPRAFGEAMIAHLTRAAHLSQTGSTPEDAPFP